MLINGVCCDGWRADGSPRPEGRFAIGIVAMDSKPTQQRTTTMARDEAPPDTAVGPAGVIARLITAMRAMGASDEEIGAAISGTPATAMDDPPRTPGTPIAPSDRAAYPGASVYPPNVDMTMDAAAERSFHACYPNAPKIGVDYRPMATSHRVSPSAEADFFRHYPNAARIGGC